MDMAVAAGSSSYDEICLPNLWFSKTIRRIGLYGALVVLDLLALGAAPVLGAYVLPDIWGSRQAAQIAVAILPVYLIFAVIGNAYSVDVLCDVGKGVGRALKALILAAVTLFLVAFFMKTAGHLSRLVVGISFVGAVAALAGTRALVHLWGERRLGREWMVDEIVIQDGRPIQVPPGVRIVDARALRLAPDANDPIMLDRLSRLVRFADRVIVSCHRENEDAWVHILRGLDIHAELRSERFENLGVYKLDEFGGRPTMVVSTGPLSLSNRLAKRVLDLSLTIPVLIFIAPALAMIAIAIKLDSPGPVLFCQQRMGKGNRLFRMYKFRSMRTELCDHEGRRSASRDDDRVTRLGRFLRRTSLDELPQLFNVLRGDMSLVGPRPHALGSTVDDALFGPCAL